MKNFIMLFLFCTMPVLAQTLISYEDGSTYTLEENEVIYVAPQSTKLFTLQTYSKGDVYFRKQAPWANRDYVAQPTDGFAEGSHEWCKVYEPWSEGYTFAMQTFQRYCDTNNDDKYGCGDEKFDASDDSDVCLTTSETTGSTGTAQSTGSFTDVDEYGFSQACADFDTDQQATFGYISWQQICDTNNDGEYSICDYYEPSGSATFADIQYNKQCLNNDGG